MNPSDEDVLDSKDKIYETEPTDVGQDEIGFSAQKQKDEFLGGSSEKAESQKKKSPAPEDIGFRRIPGLDFDARIDTTEVRRTRWNKAISVASESSDTDSRRKTIDELARISIREEDPEAKDAIDYVRSFVANWEDFSALKRVVERGERDSIQEAIIRHPNISTEGLDFELKRAIDDWRIAAFGLAQEKYGQEHNGVPYQTAEQKAELEEAKKRAGTIKVR